MTCVGRTAHGAATKIAPLAALINLLATALVAVAGILTASDPVRADASSADFIGALANQGLGVIRSNVGIEQKAAYFHQMPTPPA